MECVPKQRDSGSKSATNRQKELDEMKERERYNKQQQQKKDTNAESDGGI